MPSHIFESSFNQVYFICFKELVGSRSGELKYMRIKGQKICCLAQNPEELLEDIFELLSYPISLPTPPAFLYHFFIN